MVTKLNDTLPAPGKCAPPPQAGPEQDTPMTEDHIDKLNLGAEKAIQKILSDLEEKTGREVASVDVDTRNFANLAVSIFLEEPKRND